MHVAVIYTCIYDCVEELQATIHHCFITTTNERERERERERKREREIVIKSMKACRHKNISYSMLKFAVYFKTNYLSVTLCARNIPTFPKDLDYFVTILQGVVFRKELTHIIFLEKIKIYQNI